MNKQILLSICLFFILSFKNNNLVSQQIIQINSVEAASLIDNIKNNSVIIDGRDSLMYLSRHIKNAINIDANKNNLPDLLSIFLNKDEIIIYCTTSNRSNKIINTLGNLGYKGNIICINDGITGWKANGFDLETDKTNF